jgi:flagellar basal-body rod protein FlgB
MTLDAVSQCPELVPSLVLFVTAWVNREALIRWHCQDFGGPSPLKDELPEHKRLIKRRQRFGEGLAHVVHVVDATTNNIERYMDLLADRQKLVVSNIANIDTPGYKSKDIDFQLEFISMADSAESRSQGPNVVDTPGLVVKSDGNNVSLDRETRLLAETALRFNVASNLMKAQLKIVQSAIKEGQT